MSSIDFRVVLLLALAGVVTIIAVTVWRSPSNLISLGGMAFFVVLLWLLSAHPIKVLLDLKNYPEASVAQSIRSEFTAPTIPVAVEFSVNNFFIMLQYNYN